MVINTAEMGWLRKIHGIALGNHQRKAEVVLHHGADDEGQNQRGHLKLKFAGQVPEDPEADHQGYLHLAVIQAEDPDQAEEQDEGEKDGIGNFQNLHPETDEREVQDEEHDISQVHAHDRAPEEVGVFGNEHGARLDAVNHEGAQEDRDHGVRGNPQRKERDERPARGCVVRRLGPGYPLDHPGPELFRVPGQFLLDGVGAEGRDHRGRTRAESR